MNLAATELGSEFHAVVLAAGAARRFGGRKLLAAWQGAPLLHGALSVADAAPVSSVVVVTGSDAADVAAAAKQFFARTADPRRLRIVHAPAHAEGMSASLKAGLASLPASAKGCFVFLGDMPRVPAWVAGHLLDALSGTDSAAAAPVCQGQRGHPVLICRTLFARFQDLGGDRGARGILDALGSRLLSLPVADPGVLFDVDEPHQLDGS